MGKRIKSLTPRLEEFIENQKIFFVATAMKTGNINLSPKGLDTLKILNSKEVIWLNLTGSGNETATHLLHQNRMTIRFCAFEGNPLILRLYGNAVVYHPRDNEFREYSKHFPNIPGSRQIIKLNIELVQTSCGFGVPLMEYKGNRTLLKDFAENKGEDGINQYWQDKNTKSLDGHETGIFQKN